MLITLSGIIGVGKSSLTKILAEELGTKAFYEPVADNPVLPLFYEGNEKVAKGESLTNPYSFLLQIFFLNRRFDAIKKAMQSDNNVLDRSIYEDRIFSKMNYDRGNMTKTEWDMYSELLDNMLEELPYAAHKKSPDLMVMIDVDYDTMVSRIKKRGREYEQVDKDPSLVSYYKELLSYYDDWKESYDLSPLLVIDGNKYDFVENLNDRAEVLEMIESKLLSLGKISVAEYHRLVDKQHEELLTL